MARASTSCSLRLLKLRMRSPFARPGSHGSAGPVRPTRPPPVGGGGVGGPAGPPERGGGPARGGGLRFAREGCLADAVVDQPPPAPAGETPDLGHPVLLGIQDDLVRAGGPRCPRLLLG